MVAASELASRQGRLKLERKLDKVTVCSGESRDQEHTKSQRGRGRRGAGRKHKRPSREETVRIIRSRSDDG